MSDQTERQEAAEKRRNAAPAEPGGTREQTQDGRTLVVR